VIETKRYKNSKTSAAEALHLVVSDVLWGMVYAPLKGRRGKMNDLLGNSEDVDIVDAHVKERGWTESNDRWADIRVGDDLDAEDVWYRASVA
jgi:hypothetical protein